MSVRYLKDGQDWDPSHFSKDFGFTGSAKGRHDPKNHPLVDDGEFGDGTYVEKRAKGGKAKGYAMGGPQMPGATPSGVMPPPTSPAGPMRRGAKEPSVKMPISGVQNLVKGAGVVGALQAMKQLKALGQRASMGAPGGAMPPGAAPAPMPTAPPGGAPGAAPMGMAKGGFLKKAISRPGRETRRAKEHGVSVHEQMEHDSHSSNPSLRGAGELGLRLTKGDLSSKKRK